MRDSDSSGFDFTSISNAGPDLTDERWHHIVAVRDANIGRIIVYVDGEIVDSINDGTTAKTVDSETQSNISNDQKILLLK